MKESIDTELRDVLLEAMDSYCEGFAHWLIQQHLERTLELRTFFRYESGVELLPKKLVELYRRDHEQANSTPIR